MLRVRMSEFMSTKLTSLSRTAQTTFSTVRSFLHIQPFTLRGALVVVLSVISIYFYAIAQNDLVIAVVAGIALFISALSICVALTLRLLLARSIQIELIFPEGIVHSKSHIPCGIKVEGVSVLPFFSLSLERNFTHKAVKAPLHIIRGRGKTKEIRYLSDYLIFPHRGLWKVDGIRLAVQDIFGLCSISWTYPIEESIEVSPPFCRIRTLSVLASSSKSGEEVSYARERTGDWFDLKPYQPSDGVKRILWKTFAKTRQLVVRRQEPAIIPDGKVAVYLLAKKEEDPVAAAAYDYVRQLEEQEVSVLFGTDALEDCFNKEPSTKHPVNPAQHFTRNLKDILRAINHTVWSFQAGTGMGFQKYIESLRTTDHLIHDVVVFVQDNYSDSHSYLLSQIKQWIKIKPHTIAAPPAAIETILSIAQHQSLQVTFALVPESLLNYAPIKNKLSQSNLLRQYGSIINTLTVELEHI